MGFFKDIRTLNQTAGAMRKDLNPAARMREATVRVREIETALATQTARVAVATTGESATAQVLAVRSAGSWVNMQPLLDIDLLVTRAGQPPYPVTIQQVVPTPLMGQLVPGATLPARVDPADGSAVLVGF